LATAFQLKCRVYGLPLSESTFSPQLKLVYHVNSYNENVLYGSVGLMLLDSVKYKKYTIENSVIWSQRTSFSYGSQKIRDGFSQIQNELLENFVNDYLKANPK